MHPQLAPKVRPILIKNQPELTNVEIDLINRIKDKENEILRLVAEVRSLLAAQSELADLDHRISQRFHQAEPGRWAALAKTSFQVGFMYLVRAVSQPPSSEI